MTETASDTDAMDALDESGASIVDTGRDEREESDGLYERAWWEVECDEGRDARLREFANAHSNVTFRPASTTRGPDATDTMRLSVKQCIRPVPAHEHDAAIDEMYGEERDTFLQDQYEAEHGDE